MKDQVTDKKMPPIPAPGKPNDAPKQPNPKDIPTTEVTKEDMYESHGTASPDEAPEGNAWELDTKPDEERDLVLEPPMRNTKH